MPVSISIAAAKLATAVTSAIGGTVAAKRNLASAKEASKTAMVSGITDVVKAREERQAQKELVIAKEKATTMWVIIGLVALFVVLIVVTIIKRKKSQQA